MSPVTFSDSIYSLTLVTHIIIESRLRGKDLSKKFFGSDFRSSGRKIRTETMRYEKGIKAKKGMN